ncbi:MAG: hypothetical protein J5934_06395 [Succinivibrio sp.]|nr:hypothetical protein [Succinivibrio sp.]
MSYSSGNIPNDGGSYMDAKDFKQLPALKVSGLFKIGIQNAQLKEGTTNDGKPYKKMQITAGVYGKDGAMARRCRFSFYLPQSDSMSGTKLEALCYFTNQRNDQGFLFCPDPVTKSGVASDGHEWEITYWSCFRRDVHVLLDYEGEDNFNGFNYQKYKFINFVDGKGRSAQEVSEGASEPMRYKTEIANILEHQKAQMGGKQPRQQTQSYGSQPAPAYSAPKPKAQAKPQAQPEQIDTFTDDEIPF